MSIDRDEPTETERWLKALDGPDLGRMQRVYEALAETGAAPAAALLRARLGDARPSGLHDERGWPLSQGDLAAQALRRLLHRRPELAWDGMGGTVGTVATPGPRIADRPAAGTAPALAAARPHPAVSARPPLSARALALLALLPALAGLAVALKALLQRRPERRRDWLALVLGLALCARTLAWVAPDLLR